MSTTFKELNQSVHVVTENQLLRHEIAWLVNIVTVLIRQQPSEQLRLTRDEAMTLDNDPPVAGFRLSAEPGNPAVGYLRLMTGEEGCRCGVHPHRIFCPVGFNSYFSKREALTEPDMDRMGAQHIKPCTGCDAMILWAKHVRTEKPAPLIKAVEGEKPNIAAWYDEEQKHWIYAIGNPDIEIGGANPPLEFVSHFSNCPKSKDFKPHQWKDGTTR